MCTCIIFHRPTHEHVFAIKINIIDVRTYIYVGKIVDTTHYIRITKVLRHEQ
jgi:hypothetical protein